MPAQRPPQLLRLRPPPNPSRKKEATILNEQSSDDSEDVNPMELDEREDEREDNEVQDSGDELRQPMDDSDLRSIDRGCFDALSVWLSDVSLSCSVWNTSSFE